MPKSSPTTMPQDLGPVSSQTEEGAQSAPATLTPEQLSMMSMSAAAMPIMTPPPAAGEGKAAGTWQADKRIIALWSINQNRNSWAYVANIGWKKLANTSDSAIVSFSMLAAHARTLNRRVDYREEADGMIYEMYVW